MTKSKTPALHERRPKAKVQSPKSKVFGGVPSFASRLPALDFGLWTLDFISDFGLPSDSSFRISGFISARITHHDSSARQFIRTILEAARTSYAGAAVRLVADPLATQGKAGHFYADDQPNPAAEETSPQK